MIIDFRKPGAGALTMPLPMKGVKGQKGVNAGRNASHTKAKTVMLIPGINEISDDVWNIVRTNKKVAFYLAEGHIVEKHVEEKKDAKDKVIGVKTLKAFAELESEEQEVLVKETFDVALLEKWRKKGNDFLKGVIDDQIDLIKNPNKDDEE